MAIVGYGYIGAACAKIAKKGFNMRVTGVKRNPDSVQSEVQRSFCDEIVGNDQFFNEIVQKADFVVDVLPKIDGITDGFFNMESTFSKMKKSAIFMNIGRGTTVNEPDLIQALKDETIGGAVLDVFEKEPLPKESELWGIKNLFMTFHCADVDLQFQFRAF